MNSRLNPYATQYREEVIDLSRYVRLFKQEIWKIVFFAFLVTCLALLLLQKVQPKYEASTTVLIESREANVLNIQDVYSVNASNKEYFQTQFEILKSKDLAEKVVERLDLLNHPLFRDDGSHRKPQGFVAGVKASVAGVLGSIFPGSEWVASLQPDVNTGPADPNAIKAAVVNAVSRTVQIHPVRNTQLVKISYQSRSPELAASIPNALAQVFIESHMSAKIQVTQTASHWLNERLGSLHAKLTESEHKLQDYREQANLVDVQGVQTLDANTLEQLSQRYMDVRKERMQAESLYRQVRGLGGDPSTEQLLEIPSILNHSLIKGLKETEVLAFQRVSELSKRYGPRHPVMVAAESELRTARMELGRQVLRVSKGFSADYQALMTTESSIKKQIDTMKGEVQELNRKEFRLRELEREVESNRELYDMFLTRAKETSEAEGLQSAHARVIDSAVPPRRPVAPNKKLILMAAFVGSAIAYFGLVVLISLFDRSIRSPQDIDHKLHIPMLGVLPEVKGPRRKVVQVLRGGYQEGSYSEAIRTIRTSLLLSTTGQVSSRILVTSSLDNEGKSTVAVNLALSVAKLHKTLLIDADVRRPSLSGMLSASEFHVGLSEVMTGRAGIDDAIQPIRGSELHYLSAGELVANPQELLSGSVLKQLLERLSEKYEVILLDSAPVGLVSDAVILARQCDATVFTIKSGHTSEEVAQSCIDRLRDAGSETIGAVFNRYNEASFDVYGSYGQSTSSARSPEALAS